MLTFACSLNEHAKVTYCEQLVCSEQRAPSRAQGLCNSVETAAVGAHELLI